MNTTEKPMVVALLGAGGKMGQRITNNLLDEATYSVLHVEISDIGQSELRKLGINPVPEDEALDKADAVILALPDKLIGRITQALVPKLRPGARLIGLDPAAAYANVIPIREDLTYFVTHPCHPPLFAFETTMEAHTDWFGGVAAKQSIVCALHHGPEEEYQICENLAKAMYKPILRSHRITVEQMAILEPAIVETTTACLISACREALEIGIKMGIPEEAAWDFVMGHLRTELAIIFGQAGFPFSDGAKLAVANAQKVIFKDDWKEQIFNLPAIRHSVQEITDSLN